MGFISRLEKIRESDKAYAARYALVISGSICIHAVLAMMFLISGRTDFFYLNLASILLYFLWLSDFSRHPVTDIMLLTPYADVLIHACIYNLILGKGPGFCLYPFTIIPISFFLSSRDAKVKYPYAVSSCLSLLSIFLMLATLNSVPLRPYPDMAMDRQFFQVNLLMSGLLLCLHTWEFLTETSQTQDNLTHHAEYDQLTGLRNRYSLLKETERIRGSQYCVVMCDIDDFKLVNDAHGHTVGDTVLAGVGKAIQSCLRREDIICRWGGEEFLLVIRSDMETARSGIERIRRKLRTVSVPSGGVRVTVTMTFGIADCLEADSFEKVTRIADANLLRGKHCGKNCIVDSNSAPDPNRDAPIPTELDCSFLDSPVFAAFAATSDTTYIYVCNLSTNVSRWSRTAVDYFGLPGEYMLDAGNIWLGFVHPDDRAEYAEDVEAVLSGKKRTHDVTYRARNKNGEYVLCACKGIITGGDATHPSFFAGTMTNLGIADSGFTAGK